MGLDRDFVRRYWFLAVLILLIPVGILAPGAGLALHIHPNYEEAMLVLEGNIEAVLEDETRVLGPGDILLAPAGVKHTITNQSVKPARVLAIYPTTTPEREFV